MPNKKKRNTSFFSVFNDTKKLVNTMVCTKFKDIFLVNQTEACKKVVQLYMKKEYVQKKEVQMISRAWNNNSEKIRDMYENVIKGLLYILFFIKK